MSGGEIAGAVIGVVFGLALLGVVYYLLVVRGGAGPINNTARPKEASAPPASAGQGVAMGEVKNPTHAAGDQL